MFEVKCVLSVGWFHRAVSWGLMLVGCESFKVDDSGACDLLQEPSARVGFTGQSKVDDSGACDLLSVRLASAVA